MKTINIYKLIMRKHPGDYTKQLQDSSGLGDLFKNYINSTLKNPDVTELFINAFPIAGSLVSFGEHSALTKLGDAYQSNPDFYEFHWWATSKPKLERAAICYALAYYKASKAQDKIAIINKLLGLGAHVLEKFDPNPTKILNQRKQELSGTSSAPAEESKTTESSVPSENHASLKTQMESTLDNWKEVLNHTPNFPFDIEHTTSFSAYQYLASHGESKHEEGTQNVNNEQYQELFNQLNIVILHSREMALDHLTASFTYFNTPTPTILNSNNILAIEYWLCLKQHDASTDLLMRMGHIKTKLNRMKDFFKDMPDSANKRRFTQKIDELLTCIKNNQAIVNINTIVDDIASSDEDNKPPLEAITRCAIEDLPVIEACNDSEVQSATDTRRLQQELINSQNNIEQSLNNAHSSAREGWGLSSAIVIDFHIEAAKKNLFVGDSSKYRDLTEQSNSDSGAYTKFTELKQKYDDVKELIKAKKDHASFRTNFTEQSSIATVCEKIKEHAKLYKEGTHDQGSLKHDLQQAHITNLKDHFNLLNNTLLSENKFTEFSQQYLDGLFNYSDNGNQNISTIEKHISKLNELRTTAMEGKIEASGNTELQEAYKALMANLIRLEAYIKIIKSIKETRFILHGAGGGTRNATIKTNEPKTVHKILTHCSDADLSLPEKITKISGALTSKIEKKTSWYNCFWKTDRATVGKYNTYSRYLTTATSDISTLLSTDIQETDATEAGLSPS